MVPGLAVRDRGPERDAMPARPAKGGVAAAAEAAKERGGIPKVADRCRRDRRAVRIHQWAKMQAGDQTMEVYTDERPTLNIEH